MTSATDDVQQTAHIHGAGPRARRDEDALLHPHHLDEDLGVDEFHELVGDDAQALDVVGNIEDHRMYVDAAHPPQLHGVDHAHEGFAMLPGESAVQITLQQGLRGTQAHGGGQHLRIADGGARKGERAGVLVDAEREDGGGQTRYLHVALQQKVQHGGRAGAVGGKHPVLTLDEGRALGVLVKMVVEDHHLDVGTVDQPAQVADALGVGRVDDYQLPDLALVDQADAQYGQALPVQRHELPDVGIERAAEDDPGLGVEERGAHSRRQSVQIGVLMGGYHRRDFDE